MNNPKPSVEKIKNIAPKAWKDVESFYQENFSEFISKSQVTLDELPFEMMIGLLLKYFNENGVEWDVSNTEYEFLPDTLLEVFENYEKVISHFS